MRLPRRGALVVRVLVVAGLALLAAGLAFLAVSRTTDTLDLQEALAVLAGGDADGARSRLEAHSACTRHQGTARAALALADLWRGPSPASLSPLPSADLRAAGALLLMRRALVGREPMLLERIADLAARSGDPLGPAFELAAQVESSDDAGARASLRDRGPAIRSVGLGREAERVLREREGGAVAIVRDRRGRALGVIDGAGFLKLDPTVSPALVQSPVEAAAARFGMGRGLRLSLDLELSRRALQALGSHRGSVVLLDSSTGQVLAAVSDERTRRKEPAAAFEQRREPASISKIVTTVAALRAGLDPDTVLSHTVCHGHQNFAGGTLWCSFPGGRLRGLAHAMAISCNVVFANLGVSLGRAAILEELRRFGFMDGETAGSEAGRIVEPEGDARQLADLSIGLTATDITPVHAARFAAVLAQGAMPESALLSARDGMLGFTPERIDGAAPRPILEPAWIPLLWKGLSEVTRPGGTASGVAPDSFPVAMKTGTASQWGVGYHCNYVGVGPLPSPRIAFCVRVTHQSSSGRATQAARDVTRRLLESLAAPGA